jgi:hypothetical protein
MRLSPRSYDCFFQEHCFFIIKEYKYWIISPLSLSLYLLGRKK